MDSIVNRAGPLDDTARRLYRITLANCTTFFFSALQHTTPGTRSATPLASPLPSTGEKLQCRFSNGLPPPISPPYGDDTRVMPFFVMLMMMTVKPWYY